MIENAVRLIMQRLRASGIVKEDVTDDAAEAIIRLTLNELFPQARLPWPKEGPVHRMPPTDPEIQRWDPDRPQGWEFH